ncbi:NADH-dependent FMN reductase RutF [Alkalilimnicola ehrlichii]|uniref:FMN reductase (NADH) RutF n=1 Tax=Alkalilimnicola ehrlichii TaxID=351052 RepID=A0A3E0WZD8_9GAMM|nr:pyrimidine utilization flavin reductase protein F [Alkalilimnicola ehrlichii]RFA38390.1 pyrimidine utilization flavin reductase protein F [Alkalilimnicola ehrlichii]
MQIPQQQTPNAPPAGLVSREAFRDAMARLAAAVNIVTTDGPHGRAGFTATAVCSVTDTPPTLLVCLNRAASAYPYVKGNGAVCVNTLTASQRALSQCFGGKTPMDERFAATAWSTWLSGAPVLEDAAAVFDCRVSRSTRVGTHDILFCEVLALRHRESDSALVYFDRNYHGLPYA